MVEFGALVKGTFRKFQLQAEVAVLDHDATKRQKAFGVELFDLIEKQRVDMRAHIEKTIEDNDNTKETKEDDPAAAAAPSPSKKPSSVNPEAVESFMKVFQTIENEIRGPLEECRADVARMTESNYLPILIQKRKQDFGVEIWPVVTSPKWLHESLESDLTRALNDETVDQKDQLGNLVNVAIKGVVKGTKTTVAKAIGKLSPEQREVETCVKVAKQDVAVFEEQKSVKLTEIQELVSGGTTLECC